MLFAIAFAASLAQQTTSQPSSPSEATAIVVEGNRERKRAIHDFVTAVTPSRLGGQLSRFEDKACPAAAGLSPEQNRLVTTRMRQIAEAAGVPLAPEGCGPNALVIVADQKEDFVAALRKRYPAYFRELVSGSATVPQETGPAVAWHINGWMSSDHVAVGMHKPGNDGRGGTYYFSNSTDASHLNPQGIPHFLAGVVVVEAKALVGLTTTQLADYAALRLYARTDPQKLKPTAASVLGILAAPMGSPIPLTMTAWDLAFLKGLYSSDDRQYANRQRGEIESKVLKQVVANTDH